jgi:hypothetical protein
MRSLPSYRRRWEDNIAIDIKYVARAWTGLTGLRVGMWWAVVNTVMNRLVM